MCKLGKKRRKGRESEQVRSATSTINPAFAYKYQRSFTDHAYIRQAIKEDSISAMQVR